jgi:hypothetical protein
MITETITWSFFYKGDTQLTAEDLGIKEDQNSDLETYLKALKKHKKRLDTEGVTRIAVYHTLMYEGQCNTEFSPKILALLQELNATFCLTAQSVSTVKNLYDVLDKIRERPSMYTGEHSLTAIYHFINGFYMACDNDTSETPSFDGFNDFVGRFYGKYTTAGWKNLILSDHYGNETEAVSRFYELLDEYRAGEIKYNSRAIVLKLLNAGLADLATITDHKQDLINLLQIISSQMNTAIYGKLIVWFDTILEDVFALARDNEFLHNWIKTHAPQTDFYEHELWSGSDGKVTVTTLIPSNHKQKDYVLDAYEVLIKRFFTMNLEKAKEVKEAFLAEQDALIDAKNAFKKKEK